MTPERREKLNRLFENAQGIGYLSLGAALFAIPGVAVIERDFREKQELHQSKPEPDQNSAVKRDTFTPD
ncbi:MAG: hypothetical protein K9G62_00350 [Alphaproteobacteria bacterium]|nr:hypothetical protein [Alphaproteobacteria bacterium]